MYLPYSPPLKVAYDMNSCPGVNVLLALNSETKLNISEPFAVVKVTETVVNDGFSVC